MRNRRFLCFRLIDHSRGGKKELSVSVPPFSLPYLYNCSFLEESALFSVFLQYIHQMRKIFHILATVLAFNPSALGKNRLHFPGCVNSASYRLLSLVLRFLNRNDPVLFLSGVNLQGRFVFRPCRKKLIFFYAIRD